MFCFAKFCCICLRVGNSKNFLSIHKKYKDELTLLDKIKYCFDKEFQEIINYKIPNAIICSLCKDRLLKLYKFAKKTKDNIKKLKGYANYLSNDNYKSTASNLQVCLSTPKKKNKTISFHHTEINEISVLATNIEDTFQNSYRSDNVKSGTDSNIFDIIEFSDNFKLKQEPIDIDTEIKEVFIKPEPMDVYESGNAFTEDVSIKEEFSIHNPVDIKDILNDFNFSCNETLPLPEPEEQQILEEPLTVNVNTTQEIVKQKKPTPIPCPLCKNIFYSANATARHLTTQHNNGRFNCNVCDLSFKSEMVLKRHVLIHSDDLYTCKF